MSRFPRCPMQTSTLTKNNNAFVSLRPFPPLCWDTSRRANICEAELLPFRLKARKTHLLCKHVFNHPPESPLHTNRKSHNQQGYAIKNGFSQFISTLRVQLPDTTCHNEPSLITSIMIQMRDTCNEQQIGLHLTD